ncbi:MAG: hypothetical protein K2J82_09835 [Muribaculaceae bacterium]|nr:hypothetical protein [Muribaculaceae bacterium]
MKKNFFYFGFLAISLLGAASCSDSDSPEKDDPSKEPAYVAPVIKDGAFILTQGAYYAKLEGGLFALDYSTGTMTDYVFKKVNDRNLGATPQCGIVYGSKMYLGIWESNTIEILDRYSFRCLEQISLGNSENGQKPRSMVAYNGKVYVSMYDGKVTRLDTLSMRIDASVEVGPNPDKMALYNGRLYVPITDGENWGADNYAGTTVSVVSLSPFEMEKSIDVPFNPTSCVAAAGSVFVLCKGNYADIPSALYQIKEDDSTEEIGKGNMVAASGDKLYLVDAVYMGKNSYYIYDIPSKTLSPFPIADVEYPSGIAVDEKSGKVFISSYQLIDNKPQYELPCYLCELDLTGKLLKKYDIGVGEASIFFTPAQK